MANVVSVFIFSIVLYLHVFLGNVISVSLDFGHFQIVVYASVMIMLPYVIRKLELALIVLILLTVIIVTAAR